MPVGHAQDVAGRDVIAEVARGLCRAYQRVNGIAELLFAFGEGLRGADQGVFEHARHAALLLRGDEIVTQPAFECLERGEVIGELDRTPC